MNILRHPPIMKTLDYVSDNLYQGYSKQFLDFDNFCQSDTNTSDYRQVDTLVIYNDIIYLIEFKKCDLFYQDIEALEGIKKIKNIKTMKDILKKAPEKVENCLLVYFINIEF